MSAHGQMIECQTLRTESTLCNKYFMTMSTPELKTLGNIPQLLLVPILLVAPASKTQDMMDLGQTLPIKVFLTTGTINLFF
jgi:hypothetical protein